MFQSYDRVQFKAGVPEERRSICGTRGMIDTDRAVDGRISVRWDDPAAGHPSSWPLVDDLELIFTSYYDARDEALQLSAQGGAPVWVIYDQGRGYRTTSLPVVASRRVARFVAGRQMAVL